VADAPDELRCCQAAENEARSPGRAEQAERRRFIAFSRAANRQQQAVQAIAHEQEQSAEEQGKDGQQISSHFGILGYFNLKIR
jgi:hypothetical protein